MEPVSPPHPFSPLTTANQKTNNRETSIVELAPTQQQQPRAPSTREVDRNDDRGVSTDAAAGEVQAPAARAPAILRTSLLRTVSSPVRQYSPTKTEIESHPIRQRLRVHGEHIAASGRGTKAEEDTSLGEAEALRRQDELDTKQGSEKEDTGKMTEVKEGDKVAWNWGGGAPGGTASAVVTDGEAKMVSHRGNEVKKKGSPDNPAVHIERPGNDVVKKASELEVEEKGPGHGAGGEEKKDDGKKEETTNGDAKTGEKRSADEANKDDEKKDDAPKANGDAAKEPPKKKGRPAKGGGAGGAAKKETKKKAPKAAATADGKPRRSGRNKA